MPFDANSHATFIVADAVAYAFIFVFAATAAPC